MSIRLIAKYVLLTLFLGVIILGGLEIPAAKGKSSYIKDYTKNLNRKFKKITRKDTRFIIIHTSEAGLVSTLRTVSKGKDIRGKYHTRGGHTHYVVARNGTIYRIMNARYRADHAGLSMWNGVEDISSHSIGIELIGFHYGEITVSQYKSLAKLIRSLRKSYPVLLENILTHCQVSYGKGNRWHKGNHRGRKRCGLNFDRGRIGLRSVGWSYDPDVKARRLSSDKQIHRIFYGSSKVAGLTLTKTRPTTAGKKPIAGSASVSVSSKPASPVTGKTPAGSMENIPLLAPRKGKPEDSFVEISHIINKTNTAWNIAGEDYDSPLTLYILKDKRFIRGDKIESVLGWSHIPVGTRVLLNQPLGIETRGALQRGAGTAGWGPVFTITKEAGAWSFAGKAYKSPSTFYLFPGGKILPGNRVADWDSLAEGTQMIVGYKSPVSILAVKGKTPWGIAGRAYNNKETIYYFPGRRLATGDSIKNFNDLPGGGLIFLKL
ncbi:MAG: N-acetylmuramoyl-L-alanine amidase, partial [bacterium]|nr:N-acetylmuramoyl-L-alanine amidase [bacterium]